MYSQGIVRFQVRRAVGDHAVGGGVRLVEAVAAELDDLVEDLLGELLFDALGLGAVDELAALFLDLFGDLFAHGLAQAVGLAGGKAAHVHGDAHHLFLVEDDAVGVLEDRLEDRMVVFDLGRAVLAADEIVDHARAHGAGAVERDERDDVFDVGGFELAQEVAHAARFELEDAEGARLVEQLEGLCVVERRSSSRSRTPGHGLADQLDGVVDDGQRAQAQEVDLQQAELRQDVAVVLGRDDVARALGERRILGDLFLGDHHAGGVHAGVALQPLELLRGLEQLSRRARRTCQGSSAPGSVCRAA